MSRRRAAVAKFTQLKSIKEEEEVEQQPLQHHLPEVKIRSSAPSNGLRIDGVFLLREKARELSEWAKGLDLAAKAEQALSITKRKREGGNRRRRRSRQTVAAEQTSDAESSRSLDFLYYDRHHQRQQRPDDSNCSSLPYVDFSSASSSPQTRTSRSRFRKQRQQGAKNNHFEQRRQQEQQLQQQRQQVVGMAKGIRSRDHDSYSATEWRRRQSFHVYNNPRYYRHQPMSLKDELEEAERRERRMSLVEAAKKAREELQDELEVSEELEEKKRVEETPSEVDSGLCTGSDDTNDAATTISSTSTASKKSSAWIDGLSKYFTKNEIKALFEKSAERRRKRQGEEEKEHFDNNETSPKKLSPSEVARRERIARILRRHTFGRVKNFVSARYDKEIEPESSDSKSPKSLSPLGSPTRRPRSPLKPQCDRSDRDWNVRVWLKPIRVIEVASSSDAESELALDTEDNREQRLMQFWHSCSPTCSYQRDVKTANGEIDLGKVLWYRFLGRYI